MLRDWCSGSAQLSLRLVLSDGHGLLPHLGDEIGYPRGFWPGTSKGAGFGLSTDLSPFMMPRITHIQE
jgi:hypothetical protein